MTGGPPEKSLFLRGIAALRTPVALPLVAIGLALVAFSASVAWMGLRSPVPWPDEGSFLWPALGLRDHFELFAPEVNPEREVLWMPPAFMVLHGALFSIVPFTLERARFVSTILVAIATVSVFGMVRPLQARLVHAVALCAFLAAPIVFVAGNCARMESLVLALVTSGFYLLSRGRAGGLGLVAVAPLAHPNGVFACAGAFVYAALLFARRRKRETEPGALALGLTRGDLVLLAAAALAWGAYSVHVAQHWGAFKADMAAQVRFKIFVSYGEDGAFKRLVTWPIAPGLVALIAGAVLGRKVKADVAGLVLLGASLYVQTAVAAGWLYEVYPTFAITLSTIVLVESVWALLGATLEGKVQRGVRAALGVCAVAFLLIAGRSAFLTRSLEKSIVPRDTRDPEYLTRDDRRAVRAVIRQIAKERGRVTVQFVPSGEGLVYESLRAPNIAFVEQTFYVAQFDVLIVHDSVWCPQIVHDLELLRFLSIAPQPIGKEITFRERDGTEKWHVYIAGTWPVVPPARLE